MGVKLQLVLGVVLVCSVCASPGNSNFRPTRQVSSDNAINSTTPQDAALEKTDRHRNRIEQSPKTDTELKNVNRNASIKLGKAEPYVVPPSPSEVEDDNIKTETVQKNAVEKVQLEDNKENIIKKDTSEKKREDNSRSIDIDIAKYVSSEFHSKNNVLKMPSSSDIEYTEKIFDQKFSTQKLTDYSLMELTTPRADFFDNKFKKAVESIDQKLEHIDHQDDENDDSTKELQVEKIIEEYRTTPNSNLDYKEMKNVVKNDTVDKNSAHKDTTVEEVKRINFETSFNDTKVYNDEDDKYDKYTKSDAAELASTTSRNNFILTTRKSVTLTKPPSNRNNSHILSNKIETDILKAINIVASGTRKGGDESAVKSDDNVPEENSLKRSTERGVTDGYTIDANQLDTTTGRTLTTTDLEENLVQRTSTVSIVDELIGSNVDIDTTPAVEEVTTDLVEKAAKTIIPTEEIATEPTTTLGEQTEPATEEPTTIINEEFITSKEETTTQDVVSTTTIAKEDLIVSEATSESGRETTTYMEEIATTPANSDKSSSSEIRTTESGLRTSKGMKFDYTTMTEGDSEKATDHYIETTENNVVHIHSSPRNADIPVVTEITTTKVATTTTTSNTGAPTINKTIKVTTDEVLNAASSSVTEHATSVITEATTVTSMGVSTKVINPITTPSPEESATDEYLNETVDNGGHSPTTLKPTPTPAIKFIHIDPANHTTSYPETLNPSFSYPIPDVEPPKETTNKSEQATIINTTTDAVEDSTEVAGTEEIVTDGPGDNKGTIAAIVISTVGAVCLVLLAGLLYIMRKRQKRFNYGQRCRPVSLDDYSMDNVSVCNSVRRKGVLRVSKRSYGNPAFDDPAAVTHPLNLPALAKFAVNTEDIKAEFEEIPQIAARTSELPEGCETKNRYANVIPLPETRVFLTAIDGYPNSDYINANYVTGPKNTKGYYIACQAPLQNTVDDFWRMIWEQQSKVILMITHLFENGVEKSVDYLPPSEVLDCHRLFGDFQITLKNREVKDKYIISSLQLKNMVSNSWREVTHFWYMGWPEKGVPSEANSLIAFLIEARSLMKSSTLDKEAAANGNVQNGTAHNEVNPVVVHCSPGTGRTGVVIACDIAIREFEQTRLVDIPKIVYRIRRDRASAVQTKEQYMFIYKVVSLYATKLTGGALDSF